ncbi:restriction endonuclease [Cellulomonas aerilata]|uniref:Restriction endonuclease n=1 Tax=Cellulomonas aerilata TaxID=515326 RepID=A0A512DDL5_9CELL|nr:restriction endonuclease [Cellulomonas aerilata]GEO34310.1 restriction endonuclease [Cellulomonas aerilata]
MSTEIATSVVPIWPAFVAPVLRVLSDGHTVSRRELKERALDAAGLSEDAKAEALDSGGPRAEGRVGWAITHLNKAGFIERASRAHYRITDAGRSWLAVHPEGLSDFAEANRLFAPFWPKKARLPRAGSSVVLDEVEAEVDPIEQIDHGVARVQAEVAAELLARLREQPPAFFEQAVIDVLLAMGYGGSEQRGRPIGGSGDGGVDGVIDQDALGLDQIYVQAKRYAEGNNVGREAIQAFIGALHGFGASRGVFITSSSFTPGAREYARSIPTRIVLIDGTRLTDLMIKYRVGVQVSKTYDVVEIDEDFFE